MSASVVEPSVSTVLSSCKGIQYISSMGRCFMFGVSSQSNTSRMHLITSGAYADSERSLGVYKVYYWMTTLLFLLMFVMAAWFVCLVAVNTTGEPSLKQDKRTSLLCICRSAGPPDDTFGLKQTLMLRFERVSVGEGEVRIAY